MAVGFVPGAGDVRQTVSSTGVAAWGLDVLLAVLALYLAMWLAVGRDALDPSVTVQYTPPEGFSAAALGYLYHRGPDDTQLTATVVSLAMQGALRIESDSVEWTLRATGVLPETLAPEERRFAQRLFYDGDTVPLGSAGYLRLKKTKRALFRDLQRRLDAHDILTNRGWFGVGLLVSLGGLVSLALRWELRFNVPPLVPLVLFVAWLMFLVGVGRRMIRYFSTWRRAMADGTSSWAETLVYWGFGAYLVVMGMVLGVYFDTPPRFMLAIAGLGVLNAVFYHLLARPTVAGRTLLNHVEGFRQFLAATEGSRINRLRPGDLRPRRFDRFEEFLPHAIALAAGGTWAAGLEGKLTSWGTKEQWERHRNDRIS